MLGFTERAILVEFELVDQHSWLLVFTVDPLGPYTLAKAPSLLSFHGLERELESLYFPALYIRALLIQMYLDTHTFISTRKEEQIKYNS